MTCVSKTRVILGAHDMRKQNEAKIAVRMACGSKTRQVFVAHDMRKQNEAKFSVRMACAGENGGHFGPCTACSKPNRLILVVRF
ncbi:hypothetical protein BHU16_01300 [Tannerella sp. oral taxon 808]|nr:hypothetical protein BHU16_01300 [Tannerella sp. oral taxon 808]